jgi:DNA-binding Lrp family transcriptional regulator
MKAYILIEVQPGEVKSALDRIRGIEEVKSAQAVVGPFDIIASVEVENIKALGEVVVSKIHNVEGVNKTLTCIAVEL